MDHLHILGSVVAAALALAAIACAAGGNAGRATPPYGLSTVDASRIDTSPTVSGTSATVAAGTGSPSPHAVDRVLTGRNIELTPDLDGLTVQVPAGEIFLVNLGDDFLWSLDWSPPGVARSWLATYQPRGSQGYYSLDVPGSSAVLDGRGTPNCATPAPVATCAAGSTATFHLTVVAGPPQ